MKTIKEKVLKKLRNYGYTTKEKENDAKFIIDKTLKEVLNLIEEVIKKHSAKNKVIVPRKLCLIKF